MGIATSFTSDRMLDIEQNSVVSGLVDSNGNLILEKRSGSTINAGNVVGPQGPEGKTGLPAGAIIAWSATGIPVNWIECNGQAVSRTTYADLFAIIGGNYGNGDGTTTFNVPDLRGRTLVGLDAGQTEFNTLGKKGGAKTHQLSVAELASHHHKYFRVKAIGVEPVGPDTSTVYGTTATVANMKTEPNTFDTGGDQAHNNLQPYSTQKYIIKGTGEVDSINSTVESVLLDRMADLEAWKAGMVEDTGWIPLSIVSPYQNYAADANGPARYRIKNDVLYFKGSIQPTSGNFPNSGQVQLTNPDPVLAQFADSPYSGIAILGPTGGSVARPYINNNGEIMAGMSSGYGNGSMNYMTLTAMSGVYVLG